MIRHLSTETHRPWQFPDMYPSYGDLQTWTNKDGFPFCISLDKHYIDLGCDPLPAIVANEGVYIEITY